MISSFLDYPKYLAPIDDNDRAEDNFDVLASKEQLKIIAKKISEKLRHPITIIDANRIGMDDPNKIRVNSDTEYFSLRNACKLFRHFAGSDKCYKCDYDHAQKYADYLEKYKNDKRLDFTGNYYIVEQEKNALGFFYVKDFYRPLYEYRCPMLGYRELIIPIFFPPLSDKMLGFLFIQQSVVESENDAEYIKATKENFFANEDLEKLFKKAEESDEIKKWIIDVDDLLNPVEKLLKTPSKDEQEYSEDTTMSFSDVDEYIEFIRGTCKYLRNIENELFGLYTEKRRKYFKRGSIKIIDNFFIEIKKERKKLPVSESQKSYFELEIAWKQLLAATENLKNIFGINKIYVFGDGTSLTMTENQKKPLYSPDNNTINDWYYDFSVVNSVDSIDIQNIEFISSFWDIDILYGLHAENIDKENCFIILFSDIALLFCVESLNKNIYIYQLLAEEIGMQFSRIHSSIALTTADFMQKKQLMTLRMNRHETAHISERINDLLEWNFYDNGKNLTDAQMSYVIGDLKDSSRLLSNMADNIGVIIGSITKENIHSKVEYADIDYILHKWRKMFRDKLNARTLDMKVNKSLWASKDIKTVPTLFELMIYNIVDNAVKYAYRGTNIYLSWVKSPEGNILKAVNYGPQIRDDERIFDLYVKGNVANGSQKVEGDGIGLYAVKRICDLLGCEVYYTCDFVSEYNLPLIKLYKTMFGANDGKSQELFDYELNFDKKIWRDVVNIEEIPRDQVSKMYLKKRIDDKIYKTVFTVKVPDELKF